jgi:2-polyprenyl-3-methyl-5-hydroxy-6-metoxy-1,4-benzoquinol methylase
MNKLRGDHDTWEGYYRSQPLQNMPWYHPGLDADFAAEFDARKISSGSVLDLCTGPGTQALALAEQGFSVTATDIAETAVKKACEEARGRGLDIIFRHNDILDSKLDTQFDYAIDRGCYHNFRLKLRQAYPEAVAGMLKPGGFLFLKCFSHLEETNEGPYHISPDEIREYFDGFFEVISIRDTRFTGPVGRPHERPPKALFCVMKKR